MNKNYMSEIAKMLGVNIGEEFIIQNADSKKTVILAMDGLRIPFPHGMAEMDDGRLLLEVLQGHYEIIKLPWEPKDTEFYWTMFFASDGKPFAGRVVWIGDSVDFCKKVLGMVYRTKEETEKHFAEAFKKVTGKESEHYAG